MRSGRRWRHFLHKHPFCAVGGVLQVHEECTCREVGTAPDFSPIRRCCCSEHWILDILLKICLGQPTATAVNIDCSLLLFIYFLLHRWRGRGPVKHRRLHCSAYICNSSRYDRVLINLKQLSSVRWSHHLKIQICTRCVHWLFFYSPRLPDTFLETDNGCS